MVTWAKLPEECLRKDVVVAEKVDYTYKTDDTGTTRWYANGKLTRKVNVPKSELVKFVPVQRVDAPSPEPVMIKPERVVYDCLVCGKYASRTRFVNLQLVHLCDDHYFNCTLGALVIKLRERGQYEPVLAHQ
jgi:hypothetical protein